LQYNHHRGECMSELVHDGTGEPLEIYRATGEDGKICVDWLASAVNVGY